MSLDAANFRPDIHCVEGFHLYFLWMTVTFPVIIDAILVDWCNIVIVFSHGDAGHTSVSGDTHSNTNSAYGPPLPKKA